VLVPISRVWPSAGARSTSLAAMMPSAQFAAFFRKQYDGFNQVVRDNNVKFD
jgi:hypothetical protein